MDYGIEICSAVDNEILQRNVYFNYQRAMEGAYKNCNIPTIDMTTMVTSRHGPPDVTITA